MDAKTGAISRRVFLGRLGVGGAVVGAVLAGCDLAGTAPAVSSAAPAGASTATAGASTAGATAAPTAVAVTAPGVVRLSSVVIPQESGLYAQLLPEFERRSGLKVEVTTAQDVYGPARTGRADIVLSHYQHEGVSPFMQDGFGEWPRLILSSPVALIGPVTDPAGVRGLTDLVEAFRRIARKGSPFVVNDQDGLRYLGEVARRAAALPAGGNAYLDNATKGPEAMRAAAQASGYTLWGLVPFLRLQQQSRLPLEPLVTQDQLLRSVMLTTVVNGQKVAGVNTKGARSLQHYLIEAETQAKIRTFRMAGVAEQVWWPAAHDNDKAAFALP